MKFPHWKRDDAHAHFYFNFWQKNIRPNFFFFFFGCVCRKFCHADVDSREQQASLLKKVENFRPKLRFSFFPFFRRFFWHDFVTPFSTLANIKGSLPTKSTTPDRLRCRTKTDGEELPDFWPIHFSNIVKKSVSKGSASVTIYTPKEAHSRIFVTGGSFLAWQMLAKKILNSILGRPACTISY